MWHLHFSFCSFQGWGGDHPVTIFVFTEQHPEPAMMCSPKKRFQNVLWEINFICTNFICPRDVQTLPVIGTDVEQTPGCPPELFNLTLSTNISTSDPFVSLPGYKLQLCAGIWTSRGLRKGLVGPKRKKKKKKISMFLMSFSLVYWSFCKSSLRIGSCQTSSPKIHTGASNAPRSHFNTPGSSRVRRCQSLLQHTWLALQLCEISVFTGAGKKRFLSFGKHNSGPRASRLWGAGVVFSSSEDKSDLGGFWWLQNSTGDTLGQPSLAQHPQNSLFSWKRKLSRCVRFQQEMSSRCWICAPSVAQDRDEQRCLCLRGFWLLLLDPSTSRPPTNPLSASAKNPKNSRRRQKMDFALKQPLGNSISHLPFVGSHI